MLMNVVTLSSFLSQEYMLILQDHSTVLQFCTYSIYRDNVSVGVYDRRGSTIMFLFSLSLSLLLSFSQREPHLEVDSSEAG